MTGMMISDEAWKQFYSSYLSCQRLIHFCWPIYHRLDIAGQTPRRRSEARAFILSESLLDERILKSIVPTYRHPSFWCLNLDAHRNILPEPSSGERCTRASLRPAPPVPSHVIVFRFGPGTRTNRAQAGPECRRSAGRVVADRGAAREEAPEHQSIEGYGCRRACSRSLCRY